MPGIDEVLVDVLGRKRRDGRPLGVRPCEVCRKDIILHIRRDLVRKRYCSKACATIATANAKRGRKRTDICYEGDKNPNFRGGGYHLKKHATIFRDNFKCAICGYERFFDVHHIIALKDGGLDEPNNMITLCPNHHREADNRAISSSTLLDIVGKRQRIDSKSLIDFARRYNEVVNRNEKLKIKGEVIFQV